MAKEERLYLIFFILSVFSIIVSFVLKIFGLNWFNITFTYEMPANLAYFINTTMLFVQFYLIVGSITRLEPKQLFFKLLPYFPLNILLYFISHDYYLELTLLLLFVTVLSIAPKFSIILSFVVNILIISILQFILLWIKLGLLNVVFPDILNMILLHIDEFILLGLLYYINRKWGDKYAELVIFWRKR